MATSELSQVGGSLNRQQTLESQRNLPQSRGMKTFYTKVVGLAQETFPDKDVKIDDFQQFLRQRRDEAVVTAAGGAGWLDHWYLSRYGTQQVIDARALLREYRSLKDKESRASFKALVVLKTIAPPLIRCRASTCVDLTAAMCKCLTSDLEDDTFSRCMERFSIWLKFRLPGSIQLLVIANEPEVSQINSLFSFRHLLRATFAGRINQYHLAPSELLRLTTMRDWDLSAQDLASMISADQNSNISKNITCPSLRPRHGNLDPQQVQDERFRLCWQRHAPKFNGNLDMYIWQQYRELPAEQYVNLCLIPVSTVGPKLFRVLLTFKSIKSIELFRSYHVDDINYKEEIEPNEPWSATSEVVLIFLTTIRVMVAESIDFLRECVEQIQSMELAGRRDPTADKIRYLLHLNDCRMSAGNGVAHALEVHTCITDWINLYQTQRPLWNAGVSFEDRTADLKADLTYVQSELDIVGEKIQELRNMIHEQLDLTQGRRNFVLTLIAAVYLPLSFVTSLLGMNMNTTTPQDATGFSNFINSTLAFLPQDVGNSTAALVSTIGTSGSLTWAWKEFGIIAGSLVLTLPLSLAIGRIFRWSVRFATTYVVYWRIISVILGILAVLTNIFVCIPFIVSEPIVITALISDIIIGILLIVIGVRSVRHAKRRTIIDSRSTHTYGRFHQFTGALFLTVGVLMTWLTSMMAFDFTIFPGVNMIPWLLLSLEWILPWWQRRRRRKAKTQ